MGGAKESREYFATAEEVEIATTLAFEAFFAAYKTTRFVNLAGDSVQLIQVQRRACPISCLAVPAEGAVDRLF